MPHAPASLNIRSQIWNWSLFAQKEVWTPERVPAIWMEVLNWNIKIKCFKHNACVAATEMTFPTRMFYFISRSNLIYHACSYLNLDPHTASALGIFKNEAHPSKMGIGTSKEGCSLYGLMQRCVSPMVCAFAKLSESLMAKRANQYQDSVDMP